MDLINTSPGGFFALTNTLFYLFIGLEIAMIVVDSMVGVALMLVLVVAGACMLLRSVLRLMEDDKTTERAPRPGAARPARAPSPRVAHVA